MTALAVKRCSLCIMLVVQIVFLAWPGELTLLPILVTFTRRRTFFSFNLLLRLLFLWRRTCWENNKAVSFAFNFIAENTCQAT